MLYYSSDAAGRARCGKDVRAVRLRALVTIELASSRLNLGALTIGHPGIGMEFTVQRRSETHVLVRKYNCCTCLNW